MQYLPKISPNFVCKLVANKKARFQINSETPALIVIPARFERATHSLEGCCSIQLSYGTLFKIARRLIFYLIIPNVLRRKDKKKL
jgi:hypothetical protein